MANRTVTVKSSGGDYTSLNAAFAGEDDTYADLVTNTMILTFDCYNFEDTTVADTGSAWTTSASYYLNVVAHDSHGGKWSTGSYRIVATPASYGAVLNSSEQYTKIAGIQINAVDGTVPVGINSRLSGDQLIDKCIVKKSGTAASYATGIWASGEVRNSIIYDFSGTSNCAFNAEFADYAVNNCTINNCTDNFAIVSGRTVTVKNTGGAYNSNLKSGSGTLTETTCSWSNPTFVDAGNDDFHLASSDTTWKDQGTDLSGTFTDDIDGQTRTGTWDIGADEYVSANITVSAGKKDLTLSILSAIVSTGAVDATVSAGKQDLSLSTKSATILYDTAIQVGKQDLTLSAKSATILYDTTIQAGKQDFTFSINSPTQLFDYLVQTDKQSLYLEFAEGNRFDDTFTGVDGSAPDSTKWTETDTSNICSIQNNKLNFYSTEFSDKTATVTSKRVSTGNFGVSIDFDNVVFDYLLSGTPSSGLRIPTVSGFIFELAITTNTDDGLHYYIKCTGTGGLTDKVSTTDTSGKLKIIRSGGRFKGFYWNNSLARWEWDGNLSGFDFGVEDTSDATISLRGRCAGNAFSNFNIDNFDYIPIPYQVNYDTTVAVNKQDLTLSIQAPTIRAYDIWADEYTINVGSLGSGSLGDTYAEDTAYLVINEVAGVYPTGGFSVDFIFKDIPPTISKLYVNLIGYYQGNPAHNVKVLAKNVSSSNFVNLTAETTDVPSGSADSTYQWEITIADYVSATGRLEFRFLHTSNGSVNHYLRINKLFLSEISNVISYPEKQDLTLSVLAPTVLYDTTVSVGKQDLTLSISSATIVTGNDVTVAANKQDLTLSVNQSQQLFDYLQAAGKQDLTFTVQAAAASTESQTTVAAGKQDLTLSVQAPAIEASAIHSASVQVITFSINTSTEIIACLISQPKQDLTLSVQSAAAGAGTVIILGTPAELTLVQNDISFYITHLLSVATQTAAFSILPVVVSVAQVQGALVAEILWFTASAEAKAYQPSCAVETQ